MERVYLMQPEEGGLIKIGTTTHPLKLRKAALSRQVGKELCILAALPGSYKEEGDLHKRFDHLREVGEWFRPEPELLDYVQELRSAHPEALEEAQALSIPPDAALLRPGEVAEMLGHSVSSVRAWGDAGELPVYRTSGGHRRFRPSDVLQLIEKMQHPASTLADDGITFE